MKINLLYLLIPAALGACWYIMSDLQDQSVVSFFGTAETEPIVINLDQDVYVRDLRVRTGDLVRAGDTLAILVRHELERDAQLAAADMQQASTSLQGQLALIESQKEAKSAILAAKMTEWQADIRQIRLQDSLDQALRGQLFPGLKATNAEVQQRIADVQEQMTEARKLHAIDLSRLDTEASAQRANTGMKQASTRQRTDWQNTERQRLIITAPAAGYVDQIGIAIGGFVPAHKDMMRIFPNTARKIIGFVHETTDVPFHIGDTVWLTSGVRKSSTHTGPIVAVSPKLVELPLRLRKFVEVRAWGREVMIVLPNDNPFYIGEKVAISLNPPKQ